MNPPNQKTVDESYSEIFRALGEPLRVDIIRQIAATEELACTRLEETLPISKSTISYHIKILSSAGLVRVRKSGRNFFYTLRQETFDYFLPGFLERLVSGQTDAQQQAKLRA